jgi:hypothetical protein
MSSHRLTHLHGPGRRSTQLCTADFNRGHPKSGLSLTLGNGNGSGSQISVALQYLITPALSIVAGYRVWSVSSDITTGITEQASENQLETYKTKRKGMFLQAAYSF